MTIEQLEFFKEAVKQPTFLDAAETLHISQSSLSKQIQKMEQELGVSLFDRTGRKAKLTPAGEYFYREILPFIGQYHQIVRGLSQFRDMSSLKIGTLPILALYHLDSALKQFMSLHPEISCTICEAEEEQLMRDFSDGLYDLIISRETMFNSSHYCVFPIAQYELIAALSASHPLAGRRNIRLKELSGENFILMNPYTSIYQSSIRELKKAGINFHLLRTARAESILSSVAIGEGVSLLARKNFEVFRHADVIPVSLDPPVRLTAVAAYRPDSPRCRELAELKNFFSGRK